MSMTGSAFCRRSNTEQQTAGILLREAGIMVGIETCYVMDQVPEPWRWLRCSPRIVQNPDHVEADSAYYAASASFTDVPDWAKVY